MYGPTVLEHFRRPRNQQRLDAPSASHESYNPLCGDRVRLEVAVEAGIVVRAGFTANACAVCTASASLLTERVARIPLAEAMALDDAVMIAALGTELPPARVACATLPLRALHGALASCRE